MTYNPDRDTFAAPDRRPTLQEQWREVSARIDAEDALCAAGEADPASFIAAAPAAPATDAAGRTLRHDGWTPDRQRAFLAAIADGETVERACRVVGLAVSSAYALRRRAAGTAFALGWKAASLLGRDRIADRMMTRALDGQVETVTRPDGSTITRHRFDNRHAMAMLARLDRMAEQTPADLAAAASGHAARVVAQDFEAFLDLIGQDHSPAEAGLFLARRADLDTGLTAAPAGLEPILAFARADRYVRAGVSLATEVDTTDLDLTQRAGWTAEQWQRADAAGLLRIAPAEETVAASPLPPLVTADPITWDDDAEEYRTHLPPPDGEEPDYESGTYGDPDYERGLTASELALIDRLDALDTARRCQTEAAERDAWFARVEAAIVAAETAAGEGPTQEGIALNICPLPGAGRGPGADTLVGEDLTTPFVSSEVETPASNNDPQSSGAAAGERKVNDAGHRLPCAPASSDGA